MSFLTNIWQDLVDKRLVPVLIALVVALVALSVVLARSGGGDAAEVPQLAVAETITDTAKPVVSFDDSTKIEQRAQGLLNPFQQQHVPKPVPAPTTRSAEGTTTGDSGKPSAGSDDDKSPSSSISDDYKLTVRFGAPGKTKTKSFLSLDPLPSSNDPFIVFLGVKEGKTAVFLISTDAKPTGDGICKPSETSCDKVEMKKGDVELFEVSDDTGSPVQQYELELVSVKKR